VIHLVYKELKMLQSLEFWALIVSLIAIGISLYTWYKSYQNENKLLEIEESRRSDEEIAQKSTFLKANLNLEADLLVIENVGYSEARNVQVTIYNIPIPEYKGKTYKNSLSY